MTSGDSTPPPHRQLSEPTPPPPPGGGWWRWAVVAAAAAVVLVGVILLVVTQDRAGQEPGPTTGQSPTPTPSAAPTSPPPPTASLTCPGEATVVVTDASELDQALAEAEPGDVIQIAPGTYDGNFVGATSGTPDAPIAVCGSADSVLDAGGISNGYIFHLEGVSNWVLDGFTLQNGQKGVMTDETTHTLIQNLTVREVGDEGIHLRKFSTDNTVAGNTVSQTGLRRAKIGEGIYVGTAEPNWCDITDCEPDTSDRNVITGNTISDTTAESIDVKEGTTGGTIRDNSMDGSTISAADSWVDVKGNSWLISGNVGVNSPRDGFQTHEILDGWGTGNLFRSNSATVNGPGFGFAMDPDESNIVHCDNTVSGAEEGLTNSNCTR